MSCLNLISCGSFKSLLSASANLFVVSIEVTKSFPSSSNLRMWWNFTSICLDRVWNSGFRTRRITLCLSQNSGVGLLCLQPIFWRKFLDHSTFFPPCWVQHILPQRRIMTRITTTDPTNQLVHYSKSSLLSSVSVSGKIFVCVGFYQILTSFIDY